jgi:ligand-binding sensor domain-containing protein
MLTSSLRRAPGRSTACRCRGLARFLGSLALVFLAGPIDARAQAPRPSEPDTYIPEPYRVGAGVYVRSLAIDPRRNSLWVGTSVGAMEIDLTSRDMKNTFTRKDGLASEYVFAIGVDPKGPVWFGTNAGGASRLTDDAWRPYFPMHGLADYWVYAFDFDRDGLAWIGTWAGLSKYDPASDTFTTYADELVNIWVYGLDIDSSGRVWVATEGGVSMFDGAAWHAWTHEDGLGAPNTSQLPPSANTGLGTRSRHDLSVTIGDRESYNPDYVFDVHVDNRGSGIWFGTWGGGASVFDGTGTWRSYTKADGLASNIVYSIAQEPNGVLWFGTNRGVSRFDGTQWTSFRHGLLGAHVYAIAIDPDGSVWLGTKGGVNRLVPQQ